MERTLKLRYLSLGAGVQSTTLALLAERGVLPKPDLAIFADTQWEPASVYRHLEWLEGQLSFPVVRVTAGSLRKHVLGGVAGSTDANGDRTVYRGIPAYLRQPETGELGMARRQCTREYKITPILAHVRRECLGLAKGQRVPRDVLVEQWTGISTDEAHRMKPAEEPWLRRVYPLIDLGFSRMRCVKWLKEQGYPEPPKSSCIGCPFHGKAEWRNVRSVPEEWADAVAVDEAIRGGIVGLDAATAYLHFSGKPLVDAVDLTDAESGQGGLFDNGFGNECEGMCGV